MKFRAAGTVANLLSKFTHPEAGCTLASLRVIGRNSVSDRRKKNAPFCRLHFNCVTSLRNYRVILICRQRNDRSGGICSSRSFRGAARETSDVRPPLLPRKQKWRPREQRSQFNHGQLLPAEIIRDNGIVWRTCVTQSDAWSTCQLEIWREWEGRMFCIYFSVAFFQRCWKY